MTCWLAGDCVKTFFLPDMEALNALVFTKGEERCPLSLVYLIIDRQQHDSIVNDLSFQVNRRNSQKTKTKQKHPCEFLHKGIKKPEILNIPPVFSRRKTNTPFELNLLQGGAASGEAPPWRVTKHRSACIPGKRDTSETGLSGGLEVLETSVAVGEREGGGLGGCRSFRLLIWWCQQQQQRQKTDRLEVNLALYLCSAPVEPLRLPLPCRTSTRLRQSLASSLLSVCLRSEVSAAPDFLAVLDTLKSRCIFYFFSRSGSVLTPAPRNRERGVPQGMFSKTCVECLVKSPAGKNC